MLEAKAKDQGHKRKCFPKKRSSEKIFRRTPEETAFQKIFLVLYKLLTTQKYCCPRAEDRTIFEDLRLRDQGQRLDLRGQGQGLQNVSSRTPLRPRTSSRTPPSVVSCTPGISNKQFLKFCWCYRLASRNDSGATVKTNFICLHFAQLASQSLRQSSVTEGVGGQRKYLERHMSILPSSSGGKTKKRCLSWSFTFFSGGHVHCLAGRGGI